MSLISLTIRKENGMTRSPLPPKSLISILDLRMEDIRRIVDRGLYFAEGGRARPLDGTVVGTYFARTSTRTRTAFSAGALRLGAGVVSFGPNDLQTNTGETAEDTGRVLGGMLDFLVARTAEGSDMMRDWAAHGQVAVVNAMSSEEHPTQALADLTTLYQQFGRIDDLRILYIGEGNNTATALAFALARFPGARLELRTAPGYGMPVPALSAARAVAEQSGAEIVERHDMEDLPLEVDVIYTTRWQTTGTTKEDPAWRESFWPFQVGQWLWAGSPKAVFMHDLPAHRGDEVTAEVLDGPASIAFRQAENKIYSAMAVLEWCWAGSDGTEGDD
ncbi:ornithine carbamoyltransferase [Amycolatopsis sp. NPDC054798]